MTLTNYLNPIDAAQQPRNDFIRYLVTAYPLREPLKTQFKQLLEARGNIWQTPYLEGSQPYRADRSVADFVKAGILHPEMANLFVADRSLYQHQAKAIEKAVVEQQNMIVATGTGSGKTECFLLPMLDSLLKEAEALEQDGVRVLILYPMNALVNDQVKRLRQILCRQTREESLIKFGFYTSRTEKEEVNAIRALEEELAAYSDEELLSLFPENQQQGLAALLSDQEHRHELVKQASKLVAQIQTLSRQEIQKSPPHILVTNYSMLEHMLIRPIERQQIFTASKDTFKMLVIDEAHSYDGATGTEVSMLVKRLKTAVGIEAPGQMRCIATSASLGSQDDPKVTQTVTQFAEVLFGDEPFGSSTQSNPIIWGDRVSAAERLGQPYTLPTDLVEAELYEYFYALELPALDDPLEAWLTQLSYVVPSAILECAHSQVSTVQGLHQIHQFLWYALKGHPTIHKLIEILSQSPQPWEQIAVSPQLWQVPTTIDGEVVAEEAEKLQTALAHLVQLGTLARENSNDLPLLPVRLHLLFRSIEGLYACVNPQCSSEDSSPTRQYGRLYLSERKICEDCSSPVLELASCRKCGQHYSLAYLGGKGELLSLPRSIAAVEENQRIYVLTPKSLEHITLDEDDEESNETAISEGVFFLSKRDGWVGQAERSIEKARALVAKQSYPFQLVWHTPPNTTGTEGGYLTKCPACGAGKTQSSPIGRFISFTDAPLEVMIDSLFELLPETNWQSGETTKRKLLTFSDGRQDAAFFASDFQRTHTETLYRQMVWQAFQDAKDESEVASVKQVENALVDRFLNTSIPHPDRDSEEHHFSYVPTDELNDKERNLKDCKDRARKRARELLLREFGLPSARRFSVEAMGLLACHIDWQEERRLQYVEQTAEHFGVSLVEARVFLTRLTDLIRLSGIVNLEKPSDYFPEVGGVEGGKPSILNFSARIKKHLKLQKEPKDSQDAVSFSWYRATNNRLIENSIFQYCNKVLGFLSIDTPKGQAKDVLLDQAKAELLWLYKSVLTASGVLAEVGDGRQLNWEFLNIENTAQDWCQCNSCRQVSHVPGFSQLGSDLAWQVKQCSAFKCEGTLQPLSIDPTTPQTEEENHYRYLIRSRSILPLRSQEHTAQLGTSELAQRESHFRQGKINLLSCSTTLEMGVDIGELQAVILRNFPPHVSNYQQRAGRAGRRTDGVALTLMYGQRRPHDRYYFEEPERLIAGKNQVPKLDAKNFQIQERHIRAELLAEFLRQDRKGAEEVTIAQFLNLPFGDPASSPEFVPSAEAYICRFQEWLNSTEAQTLTELWLQRLGGDRHKQVQTVLDEFTEKLEAFQKAQLLDWNALVEVLVELDRRLLDPAERKNRQTIANRMSAVEKELELIAKRRLHDELARASILPIYGFPIDVVRLMTDKSMGHKVSQGKHRLERDRRLALGEYAPGQEVVVDDRVYTSVGIIRPEKLEKKYYWVCPTCNYFPAKVQPNQDFSAGCPQCGTRPGGNESKAKLYKIPSAFTTEWNRTAKVTPYVKPLRLPTSQVFLAQERTASESLSQHPTLYRLTYSEGGRFFLSNQGPLQGGKGFKNRGFAICRFCGLDLSEPLLKQQTKTKRGKKSGDVDPASSRPSHMHPITDRPCSSGYDWMHLGHEFLSDLLKIRFNGQVNPPALYHAVRHVSDGTEIASIDTSDISENLAAGAGMGFWRSLTSALLAAAAQVIDVPRTELDGLFRPADERDGTAEIVLYDNVPGGAGYSRKIGDRFPEVLQRAYEIVDSCSCGSSCYDCLRTYSNQIFHHELDRHVIKQFLQPLVEQVNPEQHPELQAFAPDANTLSLAQMRDRFMTHCQMASAMTVLYLPQIEEPMTLKHLDRLIRSLQHHNLPLELMVQHLPQPISVEARILRRRLQQWIDLAWLNLYQVDVATPIEFCFSTEQEQHKLALRFQPAQADAPAHWLQTRTQRGVERVLGRLQQLKAQARRVLPKELADPDSQIIFPERSWQRLSLDELRQRLGLTQVLVGTVVTKVMYSDRYLQAAGGKILAQLLRGDWLAESAQVTIQIQQSYEEYRQRDTNKRTQIEQGMGQYLGKRIKVEMRPYDRRSAPSLPHKRELTLYTQDRRICRILLDKGMAFVDEGMAGQYSVSEPTYVAIGWEREEGRSN